MKVTVGWKGRTRFEGTNENNDTKVVMDTADPDLGGDNGGPTPKQVFLQSIAGCTGVDVVHILGKMRATMPERFAMQVSAVAAETDPKVFTSIELVYDVRGGTEREKLVRAVKLSQETYCSVSIMVSRMCPIGYTVLLNGETIAEGRGGGFSRLS